MFREEPQNFKSKAQAQRLDEVEHVNLLKKPVKRIIHPTLLDKSNIANNDQMAQIISCVPDLYQLMEWKLLYSSVHHGTSFKNLMRRAKSANPFLLICRDNYDNILGGYGSDSLKISQSYYGTGETFIFSFKVTQWKIFVLIR